MHGLDSLLSVSWHALLQSVSCENQGQLTDVWFELYSHATDGQRLLNSVFSVAGNPQFKMVCLWSPIILWCWECSLSRVTQPITDSATTNRTSEKTVTHGTEYIQLIPGPKPFHKFSQGVLETLSDTGLSSGDRVSSYLQLAEQLLAHAYFVPMNRISQVLNAVLATQDQRSLFRFHSILCQDLELRGAPVSNVSLELQDTLQSVCTELQHNPTHFPSRVVFHYIAGLSPQLPCSFTVQLLTVAISSLGVSSMDSLPSPTHTALELCLLCFDNTHIARKLSKLLDSLPTGKDKCHLLRCIPSQELRLSVVHAHLTQYFYCEHPPMPENALNSLDNLCQLHFRRSLYCLNGTPGRDSCFFLNLLLLLLETWLSLHGVQHSFANMRETVRLLTDKLFNVCLMKGLYLPDVWYQLQMLKTFVEWHYQPRVNTKWYVCWY